MGIAKQPGPTMLPAEASPSDQVALNRLLAMAVEYRDEGSLWQAMDLCWRLVEDFPETRLSQKARGMLLDMAAQYERDGSRHVAAKIYQRLCES